MVMTDAIDAKDSRQKAWIFELLFICVFHSMIAGTTTNARSVKIVDTVATCPMMTKVLTSAHVPAPLMINVGVQIERTGWQ